MEARDDFPLGRQRKQDNIRDMGSSEENWVICVAAAAAAAADDDDDDDDWKKWLNMTKNEGETFRHPFGQTDDMENLTKHWPCAVKTHFPGQHTRSGRNSIW